MFLPHAGDFSPLRAPGPPPARRTIGIVTRKGWLLCLASLLAAGFAGVHFWRVQLPPVPSAARLPASARALIQPFRKDSLDLTVEAQQELNYRVGMQAGATLVYAWSTGTGRGHNGKILSCQFAGQETSDASEGHSAFVAQSAGWYRWRWRNPNGRPVIIHFKMSGYYEPPSMPPPSMPYDR